MSTVSTTSHAPRNCKLSFSVCTRSRLIRESIAHQNLLLGKSLPHPVESCKIIRFEQSQTSSLNLERRCSDIEYLQSGFDTEIKSSGNKIIYAERHLNGKLTVNSSLFSSTILRSWAFPGIIESQFLEDRRYSLHSSGVQPSTCNTSSISTEALAQHPIFPGTPKSRVYP